MRIYKNKPEQSFKELANKNGFQVMRRGYPDFMILKDSKIIGFVEVKRSKSVELKISQKIFGNFCREFDMPFFKWTPKDEFPVLLKGGD